MTAEDGAVPYSMCAPFLFREGVARRPIDLAGYRESLRRRLSLEAVQDRVEERARIG